MNTVTFGAKRAFLSSVGFTRGVLRAIAPGLTAARYDLMYAMTEGPTRASRFRESNSATRQSDVRRKLGVSAQTVSRMVRSLIELGWVKRIDPRGRDRRQRWLALTREGADHMRAAFLMPARFLKRLMYRALRYRSPPYHGRLIAGYIAMGEMAARLDRVREECRDTATLWYWYPSPDD